MAQFPGQGWMRHFYRMLASGLALDKRVTHLTATIQEISKRNSFRIAAGPGTLLEVMTLENAARCRDHERSKPDH